MKKYRETAGADEETPSRAQYFSWVNSTNEGSTEAQTLTNLAFFRFMRDRFGMQLDIYAWDAGNLDGSGGLYAAQRQDTLRRQYPNGYKPIADAAADKTLVLATHDAADAAALGCAVYAYADGAFRRDG